MGESMSKRLKLQLGGEAEMEERAFSNPNRDYQLHGAAAAASSSPSEAAETQRDPAPSPDREETESLPFGPDGKVSERALGPGGPPPPSIRERPGLPSSVLEPRRALERSAPPAWGARPGGCSAGAACCPWWPG
ncbi:glutamine synthetase [Platysternon megacephalum]|uniref:Glutamine synthetase n=1 Tax=Platysternon megacephalum TaxID=55544 RepID=A0A4D9E856_9SAUR|nr:glutamine synthetase [Platysternon megacephalum]